MMAQLLPDVEETDQLAPPDSKPSAKTGAGAPPIGQKVAGGGVAPAHGHGFAISTASSAVATWAQSAPVMPKVPIRSLHDSFSACALSAKPDPDVR